MILKELFDFGIITEPEKSMDGEFYKEAEQNATKASSAS